jgi:hypothetical protein
MVELLRTNFIGRPMVQLDSRLGIIVQCRTARSIKLFILFVVFRSRPMVELRSSRWILV